MLSYVLVSALPLATSVLAHVCRGARLVALVIALVVLTAALIAVGNGFPDVHASEIRLSFDPLSRLTYAAFVLLVAVGSLYGWLAREDERLLAVGLAMTGFLGVAFSLSKDLLASTLVFELAALCGALGLGLRVWIRAEQGASRHTAAMRYTSFMVVAGMCLVGTFALAARFEVTREPAVQQVAFALLSCSVMIFSATFPISFWLPKKLERGGLMLLALTVSTLGIGGVWLFLQTYWSYPWLMMDQRLPHALMAIAAVGTIAPALMALTQRRLDHLIAYSVSSNAGAVVVGIASGTTVGITGGLFTLLSYLLATFLLLMCLNIAGSTDREPDDARAFGGTAQTHLPASAEPARSSTPDNGDGEESSTIKGVHYSFRRTPAAILALCVGSMTLAGVPPTGGFVGRWLIYEASAVQSGYVALSLIVSSALVFLACARFLASVMSNPPSTGDRRADPLGPAAIVVLLAILSLAVGVYPTPILQVISEAISGMPHL